MVGRRDPVARILDGLLHALGRYGVQRVSMTDIAAEAGISRGTLYRYFSTKEELLAALGTHVLDDFRAALKHATDRESGTGSAEHLRTIIRAVSAFVDDRPSLERLAEAEPAFVIAFFRNSSADILDALQDAIAPALSSDTNRRRRTRNTALIAELIFRVTVSYQLAGRGGDTITPEQLATVLTTYVEAQIAG